MAYFTRHEVPRRSFDGMTSEEWRDVVGCEGRYHISNLGRVKTVYGRMLKTTGTRYPYEQIHLFRNGRWITTYVHILVAAAFIGPCPCGEEVNHKDTIKYHNWVGNLEYLTRKENVDHARANGLWPSGEKHGGVKLTSRQVLKIRDLCDFGVSRKQIAQWFGVTSGAIDCIAWRKSWVSLVMPPKFQQDNGIEWASGD